jgi:hypothetical protein
LARRRSRTAEGVGPGGGLTEVEATPTWSGSSSRISLPLTVLVIREVAAVDGVVGTRQRAKAVAAIISVSSR